MTKRIHDASAQFPHLRALALPAAVVATLALGACSTFQEDKVDYTSAKRVSTLEVPPDLTKLSQESRYTVPGGVVTASGYQVSKPVQTRATAATSVGDVRVERSGNQRWLVVARPAEKLWEPVRDFWQESGFFLTLDDEKLGLMETDWAENRAKLPQDFIRNTLGKLLDSLYSTGERDKFRTRLERNANGETEIYVSHRGMQEVYTSGSKDQTKWQPRAADPELEAEFLRRMMVKLGITPEQAKVMAATTSAPPKARLVTVGNQPTVQLDEAFDRAWRRVGLSLDRTGFTVEDRDRANGAYFVRYVEPSADTKEPGFLSRMLGGTKKDGVPAQFRITVKSVDTLTTLTVLNAQGQPDSSAPAQRMMQLLADDLK